MKQPLISIILLNWNGLPHTKECLQSLKKLTYKNYEVVVVDNGSTDGSKEYLSKLKNIVYVDYPVNRGFTGGHIGGYTASKGEFVFILNNDAVVAPNILDVALKHFMADPKLGAVGGKTFVWKEPKEVYKEDLPFYSYWVINPITAETLPRSYDLGGIQEPNNVSGAAVLIRRAAIDDVGYFYDRFFAYYEESDQFARMKRAGWRVIYDPEFKIWHKLGKATEGKPFMFYNLLFRNRFMFAMRNFEPTFFWRFYKSYTKIAVVSLARYLRHNTVQDKAQFYAWAWNMLHIVPTYISRRQLMRALPTMYNRMLISEQRELVSVAVDSTKSADNLQRTLESIHSQTTVPADVIVIISSEQKAVRKKLQAQYGNAVRIVEKQDYLATSGANLSVILGKAEWIFHIPAGAQLAEDCIETALYTAIKQNAQAVFFTDSLTLKRADDFTRITKESFAAPLWIARKEAVITCGGLTRAAGPHAAIFFVAKFIALKFKYGVASPSLIAYKAEGATLTKNLVDQLRVVYLHAKKMRNQQPGRIEEKLRRFFDTHRRFAQIVLFNDWMWQRGIPLRQKLGRSKALLIGGFTLKKSTVKDQFIHIRNEYYFASNKLFATKKVTPKDPANTYLFIICRDQVSSLKKLVAWAESKGLRRIVFIDNQSTYPPLLEYLQKSKYQVIPLDQNIGHTSPWIAGVAQLVAQNEFYIVTDPDVIPEKTCPEDVLSYLYGLLKKYPYHNKAGLGLRIDNLPDHYNLKKDVVAWESQFWQDELEPNVYQAGVDTTFALYRPGTIRHFIHPSIRTGMPYVARHLPWYVDTSSTTEEERYYRAHASQDVNSWNRDSLPTRYKEELAKKERKAS